ncbi:DUF4129 domain-containing protein [Phycicoccus sp. MAQZ13P-2]|uniref:DUF4129 domain-containing protein n=1 Tax=Phycicoccus mangrovi TaxID=2840470 RepID=UPI001C0009EC|nr:DUF4129 domain-containing protein [Phycicoccus mangrovi]MBT9257987.1 DUF4129 domain-containing protein [Phycicoccus mangrovi]MBT9276251.1 DUF4129 domain-containing protein [Phycicoccus mangrovi]
MALHLAVTPADAPLDPSNEQARRWLEEELTASRYHAQPSILERLNELLDRLLNARPEGGLPGVAVPIAVGLVVAVLALVLWRVLRRDVGRSADGGSSRALDVPDVPAATLRAAARAALERGDLDAAVLDGVRAIARAGVERVLLDDAPGRTAHEVAQLLASSFPGEHAALAGAADAFDAVRYGHRSATLEQARDVLDLDTRLAAARPERPAAPTGPSTPGATAPEPVR